VGEYKLSMKRTESHRRNVDVLHGKVIVSCHDDAPPLPSSRPVVIHYHPTLHMRMAPKEVAWDEDGDTLA